MILLFQYGKLDFVLFNPLEQKFTNDELSFKIGAIPNNEFWNHIKSITWSVNCKIFCVVNEENIIVGGVYDDNILICNKTIKVFERIVDFEKT